MNAPLQKSTSGPPPSAGYEVEDAHPRFIAKVAAIVAGGVLLSLLLAAWLYQSGFQPATGQARQAPITGDAQYRSSIQAEWAQLDRETASRVSGYGWIDRPHGVVRIPVERAMALLVDEAAQKKPPASPPPSP